VLDDAGQIHCNPIYVAPETLRDKRLEQAADLYALGLVLFEAATGRSLYADDDPFEALQAKMSGPPPELPRDWPIYLQHIVACMLYPEDRRLRAPELVTRLARVLGRPEPPRGTWTLDVDGVLLVTMVWRGDIDFTVEPAHAAVEEGLLQWLGQRFLEFVGHRPTVDHVHVDQFVMQLVPMELPRLTPRRRS
jgi:hypothetical protein